MQLLSCPVCAFCIFYEAPEVGLSVRMQNWTDLVLTSCVLLQLFVVKMCFFMTYSLTYFSMLVSSLLAVPVSLLSGLSYGQLMVWGIFAYCLFHTFKKCFERCEEWFDCQGGPPHHHWGLGYERIETFWSSCFLKLFCSLFFLCVWGNQKSHRVGQSHMRVCWIDWLLPFQRSFLQFALHAPKKRFALPSSPSA